MVMVRSCIAILGSAAISIQASAAVLAVGQGYSSSPESARAAARNDLALRLQRRAELRIEGFPGKSAASVRRAIAGGRELPMIGIELAGTGARTGGVLYEARLTDASLAAYEREAARLAERLRALETTRLAAQKSAEGFADWYARIDQYRRVSAVLGLFVPAVHAEIELDEAALSIRAAKALSPVGGPQDVARLVKRDLDRANIAEVRVIAPVRADTSEVTAFSASIADGLRGELGAAAPDRTAAHTLDGRYARIDERLLLMLYLMDASFNTQRAFVFVLPAEAERSFRAPPAARAFAATLNRGLVRVELKDGGMAAPPSPGGAGNSIEVSVRMGRGNRGLYYRPGDRDRLLVKLDRPGYYYIVGHVVKENTRLSYLMEIGKPGATDRFVRRVGTNDTHRWLTVGEFTVEAPVGLEAVQVFATSGPPQRILPAARFDRARNLHLIGTDPVDSVKRTRGLVLVDVPDPRKDSGGKAEPARFAVGEAVLQFSTLQ